MLNRIFLFRDGRQQRTPGEAAARFLEPRKRASLLVFSVASATRERRRSCPPMLSAALLLATHGLVVPRLPLTGSQQTRPLSRRCKDPVAALPHPVLDRLAAAAETAVSDSTGAGEESSGTGRPEWGTWCDTELFAEQRWLIFKWSTS